MSRAVNLILEKGTDFSNNIQSYINLSSYAANSATGKLRKHYASTNSFSFNVAINTTSSVVTISMNHATSSNIEPGKYVYDVIVTSANTITRIVEGIITISPNVT